MIRSRGLLCGLAALAVAVASPGISCMARAETAPAFTPEQKALVEQTVKDYIIAHPEIVQDALLELDKRQKEAENAAVKTALKTEAKAIYDVSAGTVVGNPKGDVTLVEFFDYNCPYCRKAMTTLDALLKSDPKLRIVLRDLPIVPPRIDRGRQDRAGGEESAAAREILGFPQEAVFGLAPRGQAPGLAGRQGCGARHGTPRQGCGQRSRQGGARRFRPLEPDFNLRGTPAFVLGDEVVFGAQDDEEMKSQIAAVRQCGRTSLLNPAALPLTGSGR